MENNNHNFLFNVFNKQYKDTKKESKNQPKTKIELQALIDDIDSLLNEIEEDLDTKNNQSTNKFPIEAFPKDFQRIIQEFYKAYQLPLDYYCTAILTASSGLIGNAYCLEYKPDEIYPCILYTALIGRSSIGKTPVLKRCLAPLWAIEAQIEKEYRENLKQWKEESELSDTKLPKPLRIDLILNDVTLEAVHQAMSKNPKGLLLLQDELLAWINSLNQYRSGSDTEYWLSNWSNSEVKINRVSKDTLFIPKSSNSVIGGLQPAVIGTLASKGRKNNGFLARILNAYPQGVKKPYVNDYSPDPEILESYNKLMLRLHKLPNNITKSEEGYWEVNSISLFLSPEAREVYNEWKDKSADLINSCDSDLICALYGKLEDYCLRFAIILHLLESVSKDQGPETIIDLKHIKGSIKLSEYFRQTGLMVMNKVEDSKNPLNNYGSVMLKLYDDLPPVFETKQGIELATKLEIPERTFKRFLTDTKLFERVKWGIYSKLL